MSAYVPYLITLAIVILGLFIYFKYGSKIGLASYEESYEANG